MFMGANVVTSEAATSRDEELVLRDVRALLDQLQLDRDRTLTMQSRLTEDLGVDSLALVELCDQLERTFDVSLPDEVFLVAATPQQWLDAVVVARGGTSVPREADHAADERPARRTTITRVTTLAKKAGSLLRETLRSPADRSGNAPSSPPARSGSSFYAVYAWALLVPFAIAIWLLAVLPLTLPRRREAGRALGRVVCRALGLSVSVEGTLPSDEEPSIIAANHSSFIDGLMLYVFLDQPLTFVSSTDMEHQFLLGRIMRGFGCVFVDRGRAERSAVSVERLVNTIKSGRHVLIFPEGSISARPGLRVFHLGAFEAAASSACPVVPVGIRGSREVLTPGSYRPRAGVVHIGIGRAVAAKGNEFSDRVAMRDAVRDEIARLCGEGAT
jgi:acyl carrier protein